MKKCSTKIIAVILTLVMVFAMNTTPAFAASKKSGVKVTTNKSTIYLLDSANNKAKLKVTYGSKNVTKSAKYSVSNKKIATVNKSGTVTAKRAGTVKVKVKYKKCVRNITVRVKNPKLSLSKKNVTLNTGQTYTLKAFANKSSVGNKNVKWTSNNSGIATINKSGVISAKKTGTAKVTCSTNAGKVTCSVTVKAKEKKQDVPSSDNNSDNNHSECTTHNFVTTKEPVTKKQVRCDGCNQWFNNLDDLAIHALTSPVSSGCGRQSDAGQREVVITPGEETCTICGETRQLYNVGDVIK